jgi:hypothetical protein
MAAKSGSIMAVARGGALVPGTPDTGSEEYGETYTRGCVVVGEEATCGRMNGAPASWRR